MNTTPASWPDSPLPPVPDLEAMAQVADAGARLCERMTIASLDLMDGLVALSSRQADVLLAGDGSLDGLWREESHLVEAFGATLIDCARECGDLMLTPPVMLQTPEQQVGEPLVVVQAGAAEPSRAMHSASAIARVEQSLSPAPPAQSAAPALSAPEAGRDTLGALPQDETPARVPAPQLRGTGPSGVDLSGREPSGTEPSGTEPSGTEPSGTEVGRDTLGVVTQDETSARAARKASTSNADGADKGAAATPVAASPPAPSAARAAPPPRGKPPRSR